MSPTERCECGGELLPSVMAGLIVSKCAECGRAYNYRKPASTTDVGPDVPGGGAP